jgi:hypothetical protein
LRLRTTSKPPRSQRVLALWLLEETRRALRDQALAAYLEELRDPAHQAGPAGAEGVHPLGKSPVITDGDLTLPNPARLSNTWRTYGHQGTGDVAHLLPPAGSESYRSAASGCTTPRAR